MLVLISFGLVLVAIVLLVLGLLAGTGLTLIYLSIASSLAAGIVLVVAKVAGRPTDEAPARSAPAREPEPVGAGTTASFPTPSPAETTAPVPVAAQEPSYAPTSRQPAMAGAAVGAGGAAALGGIGEDEEDDEDFFPIEDYDRLKVSEIVPLLPELYADELDMVEQRERAGKGRVSILNRIAELQEQPLEDEAEPEPELDTAVIAPAEAPAEEGDEDFFPIEDYDELNVGEIVPLLPELYDDELDLVEDRERATKSRAAILNRITELREQPLEEEAEPEPEPEPELDTAVIAPAEAPAEEGDEDFFPIEDYDELSVGEILPLLPELYDDELDVVEDRERATKSRAVILNRIAELREEPLVDEPEAEVEPAPVAPAEAPAEEGDEDFFPIEDYDELSVGEILPLLPELYDDELDVVEDRERATKNRAAVLNRLAELRDEPVAAEPEPVAGPVPAEDEDELEDEAFFPIEDYDELSVGEILPLLPELYDDELDVVEDRERATKNRAAVLNRLAELRDEPVAAEPEPVAGPVPAEDEDELEDEAFFPIEDYDELSVGEILPLLPELYDDELDVVEDRERATKNRAAVLDRLAELRLETEPGPAVDDVDDEVLEDADQEQVAPAAAFPIGNYDQLRVSQIRALLPQLSEDELEQVRRGEQDGKNRSTVLAAIDRELGVAPPAPARKTTAKKTAAPVKRTAAPAKKTAARGTTAKKATAAKAPTAKKAPAKKTTTKKTTAKKTTAKKTTAKKTAAPVKRTAAPAKKTAARGTTAKKSTTKKAAAKKATRRS